MSILRFLQCRQRPTVHPEPRRDWTNIVIAGASVASALAAGLGFWVALVAKDIAQDSAETARRANFMAERDQILTIAPTVQFNLDESTGQIGLHNFGPGVGNPYYVRIQIGGADITFDHGPERTINTDDLLRPIFEAILAKVPPELQVPKYRVPSNNPNSLLEPSQTSLFLSLADTTEELPDGGLVPLAPLKKAALLTAYEELSKTMQLDACFTDVLGVMKGAATTLASNRHLEQTCSRPLALITIEDYTQQQRAGTQE